MHELDFTDPLALGTLFVGVLACFVAWRLYRSEVMRQRVDLTKERHEYFCLLRSYLCLRASALDKAWQTHDALQNAQDRYYFLFNQRIGNLVVEALDKGSERDAWQYALTDTCTESRRAAQVKLTRLDAWFANEAYGIQKRFDAYLRVSEQKLKRSLRC